MRVNESQMRKDYSKELIKLHKDEQYQELIKQKLKQYINQSGVTYLDSPTKFLETKYNELANKGMFVLQMNTNEFKVLTLNDLI